MSTTFTYPPDAEDGRRKKIRIFSMDDIPASASKDILELFRLASIGGQPSYRETYNHSNFTARHSNLNSDTPNLFNTPRGTSLTTKGPAYLTDTMTTCGSDDEENPETPTHTPHCCNPDDDPPDDQPDGLNGPGGPNGPSRPSGHNNQPNNQDLWKLKAFIVSLQLNFNDRPTAFAMDASKVNYAISFLSGTALDWFKPDILQPNLWNLPAWQYSYAAFLDELRTNFSPFDAVGDAEDALEHLWMCNGD
ncbi:hypothetical protein EV421DRAFT_1948353 [Armillaria borealis]|uniref:DUF4939 domain-containing protein n=1 Tax=Armillaria borealis TaxID=47425 RepID=A0AA39IUR3_9AGAR|nr:hypothetical protein EV421DRAFT_1948353 [Armillaria borealis]